MTIAWRIPAMCVTWINIRFSRRFDAAFPLEIGESRVAGGFCKRFSTTGACLEKEEGRKGEENRGWPGNTAGLDVWLRVWLVVCFNVSLNLSFHAEVPPTSSLSSRSPPAVLASNVCSWHTTCVFACVLGLRWIDSGRRPGLPFRLFEPFSVERREPTMLTRMSSSSSSRSGVVDEDRSER